MKRLVVLFLIILAWVSIHAQIQDLPDLQVSGEADIRSYLNKRSLLFAPFSSEPESLSAYLPQSLWKEETPAPAKEVFTRNFLQAEANTGLGLDSYYIHHPGASPLNSLSHQLNIWNPNDSLLAFGTNLSAGVDIASTFPISLDVAWYNNTAPDYRVSYLSFLAAHFRPEMQFGRLELKDYNLQLSGDYLKQRNLLFHYRAQSVNLQAAGITSSGMLNLKHMLLLSGGKVGGMAFPLLNWHPGGIVSLRPGFVADSNTFLPTLDFGYRTILAEGLSLKVENKPTIKAYKADDMLDGAPWVDLSEKTRLSPVPLALDCKMELFQIPGLQLPLSRIMLENQFTYSLNTPRLDKGIQEGVPLVVTDDLMQNTTTASAMLHLGDLVLHQDVSLSLAYLPEKHYHRAAYQPLLNIGTQADYSAGHYLLHASVMQSYFSKDHNSAVLPESVICDLGAEYLLGDKSIYLNLSNLFDLPVVVFSEYPSRGRALFLGMKYRF